MTMTDVVELLASLHVKGKPGPEGVEYGWHSDRGAELSRTRFRIRSGSGIAGRGDAWNVTQLPNGPTLGAKTRRRRELRRQILESLADGVRPPDRDGYE